jgi:hypothetical protein
MRLPPMMATRRTLRTDDPVWCARADFAAAFFAAGISAIAFS